MKTTEFKELKPKIVLGVAAHPDDLEFGAGGTIAKWAGQGAKVYYLVLTDGSKGSSDKNISPKELAKIRRQEQHDAAKVLSVKEVFFCNYEDCKLDCSQDVKRDIARQIRIVKPDVVITMDPTMIYAPDSGFINHPDHRAAGQATLDAVYPLARDHLSFPELINEGLEPHSTPTILLVNLERQNWFEDISSTIDKKMKALASHASQMQNIDGVQFMLKNSAKDMGKKSGNSFAEGCMRIDVR